MQAFARGSKKEAVFGEIQKSFLSKRVFPPLLETCERRRSAMSSLSLSRLSLDYEEDIILWRRIPDGFDFRDTVGAQGIKSHAVLCVDEIFTKF